MIEQLTVMRFNQANVEAIVNLMRTVDEDAYAYPDYSGRGMYGEECLGFVAQSTHLILACVAEVLGKDGISALAVGEQMYTDNMGLSFIGYFPFALTEGLETDD